MRGGLTPEEAAFRDEARRFFAEDYPADIIRKLDGGEDMRKDDLSRSQKAIHRRGWSGGTWPVEHGGHGWSPMQAHIFQREMERAGAPYLMLHVQERMIAPVIYTFGDAGQRQRFLPATRTGDILWCQGYSEPDAGSDLARLSTQAIRDGDCYRVTGTKVWTTIAHEADWIFCLVRTDPAAKSQDGISFLLIDLASPGITITPIITLDGGHEVNQVRFDDVRVPIENRIGDEGMGWTYAKLLLAQERSGIAAVAASRRKLTALRAIAADTVVDGRRLIEQDAFRRKLAEVEIELLALATTEERGIAETTANGAASSILKLKGVEIQQRLSELFLEAAGPYAGLEVPGQSRLDQHDRPAGRAFAGLATRQYLNLRKTSLYGGTTEIQKNIVAKAVLGL